MMFHLENLDSWILEILHRGKVNVGRPAGTLPGSKLGQRVASFGRRWTKELDQAARSFQRRPRLKSRATRSTRSTASTHRGKEMMSASPFIRPITVHSIYIYVHMAVHMTYINRTTSAYQKELLASPNQAGLTRTIRTETVPLKVLAAMGGDAAGKGGSRRFAFKAETDWRSMGGGAGGCMAPSRKPRGQKAMGLRL